MINPVARKLKIQNIRTELGNGGQISAPSDGIVTELNFAVGTMASTASPVASVADVSTAFRTSRLYRG